MMGENDNLRNDQKKLEKENQTDHEREEDEVHRGKWDRKEETAKNKTVCSTIFGNNITYDLVSF